MRNYTDEQIEAMDKAFDRVKNPDNWKMPIDTVISLTEDEKKFLEEAIIFYTGSVPVFIPRTNGIYRVIAEGYYLAVGS